MRITRLLPAAVLAALVPAAALAEDPSCECPGDRTMDHDDKMHGSVQSDDKMHGSVPSSVEDESDLGVDLDAVKDERAGIDVDKDIWDAHDDGLWEESDEDFTDVGDVDEDVDDWVYNPGFDATDDVNTWDEGFDPYASADVPEVDFDPYDDDEIFATGDPSTNVVRSTDTSTKVAGSTHVGSGVSTVAGDGTNLYVDTSDHIVGTDFGVPELTDSSPDTVAEALRSLYESNLRELRVNSYALSRAQDEETADYIRMVMADHSAGNERVIAEAREQGIRLGTGPAEGVLKTHIDPLKATADADFDVEFLQHMAAGHTDAVADLDRADMAMDRIGDDDLPGGEEAENIVEFHQDAVESHKADAMDLVDELSG